MNRIAIIGKFGAGKKLYDGQTVKTRNLKELLEKRADNKIIQVDTCYATVNKVKLLVDTVLAMVVCRHVFLLVSVNGMNVYLPLLFYLNKILKRHIYHYVIGSELLEMVSENRKLVKYLNAFDVNWFEYESGTRFLRQKGVTNVLTLPNFKYLMPCDEPKYECHDEYRFCTFSRVMEEKGITDAIEAVREINQQYGRKIASVDIYGPIDPGYKQTLESLLAENNECATYKGICDSDKSVGVLKHYYALLFPTRWPGEGVPGTIIDAYAAGLPIIASDWNANKEVISHSKTGILYPSHEGSTLLEAMLWSIQNCSEIDRMRIECRREYEKYSPEKILEKMKQVIRNAEEILPERENVRCTSCKGKKEDLFS